MKRNLFIVGLVFLTMGCITVPDYTGMTPEQIEATQLAEQAAKEVRQLALNAGVDAAFLLLEGEISRAEIAEDVEEFMEQIALYRLAVTAALGLATGTGLLDISILESWNDKNDLIDAKIDTLLGLVQPVGDEE